MNNLNDVGSRIKVLRENKGLSQAELGKEIGCAQTTIAEWERLRDRIPHKRHLAKLAYVLNVSIDYLLGINDRQNEVDFVEEVKSEKFIWPKSIADNGKSFTLKITDDFLKPILNVNDYAIFERKLHQNGDIVAIRFLKNNESTIRMWREKGKYVVLIEPNLEKIGDLYFFKIKNASKNVYTAENAIFKVEGKLTTVKKNIPLKRFMGIQYTI